MLYLTKKFILSEVDLAKLDFLKKYHSERAEYIFAQINAAFSVKDVGERLLISEV